MRVPKNNFVPGSNLEKNSVQGNDNNNNNWDNLCSEQAWGCPKTRAFTKSSLLPVEDNKKTPQTKG